MKREKEKEREEKSQLEERLMKKSLESESLKSKTREIEELKRKLGKYLSEKQRRVKVRESMLLEEEGRGSVIEEDLMEF